jgi:hypothetical protein
MGFPNPAGGRGLSPNRGRSWPICVTASPTRLALSAACRGGVLGVSRRGGACLGSTVAAHWGLAVPRGGRSASGLVFRGVRVDSHRRCFRVLKTGNGESRSWVRIPPHPPCFHWGNRGGPRCEAARITGRNTGDAPCAGPRIGIAERSKHDRARSPRSGVQTGLDERPQRLDRCQPVRPIERQP